MFVNGFYGNTQHTIRWMSHPNGVFNGIQADLFFFNSLCYAYRGGDCMNGGGCVRVCMFMSLDAISIALKLWCIETSWWVIVESGLFVVNIGVCVSKHVAFSFTLLSVSSQQMAWRIFIGCQRIRLFNILHTAVVYIRCTQFPWGCLFTVLVRCVCLLHLKDLLNSLWIFFQCLQTFSKYHSNTINY